jgi:hypothetical protein
METTTTTTTSSPCVVMMTLLPLEQVNPSVGPLCYLDFFDRASVERVSRACREEVRAPALWRNQLVILRSSREAPLVSDVMKWIFFCDKNRPSLLINTISLKECTNLTDEALMMAVAAGCGSTLTSLDLGFCTKLTDESVKAIAAGCS